MGWYYTYNASRKDIIAEIVAEQEGFKTIRKCTSGNVLWTVHESTTQGETTTWIGCYLLQRSADGWGYKPMSESMGPYYWSCPLAYLDLAPEACAEWREGVRKYWSKRNRQLQVGFTYKIHGTPAGDTVHLVCLRPLRGVISGREYRIPKRMIGEKIGS